MVKQAGHIHSILGLPLSELFDCVSDTLPPRARDETIPLI